MTLRDHTYALAHPEQSTDVVIVGTGPGGASLARALSKRGIDVLLLEEGPVRPRFRPNVVHTNRYHMQEGGGLVAIAGTTVMPIAAGRGVGGGSLVNSAICWRTPDYVLQRWQKEMSDPRFDERFAVDKLAGVFDMLERRLEIAETPDAVAGENNRIIVAGARALGLPGGMVKRNTPRCVGCGICNFGCPSGGKNSMDLTLLPDAYETGAKVQADIKVDQILIEDQAGPQAVGVAGEIRDPDTQAPLGRLTVHAKHVFVCAGGVGTPRLLHHAGLADILGPAVGQHLHVHPGSAVLGWRDEPVRMWAGATQGAYFEDPDMPGVLPHTLSLPPGALLLLLGKVGLPAKEELKKLGNYCGCVVMISDKGEGTVGSTRDGRATLSYRFADNDVDRIKAGMVQTARVLLAGGASRVFAPVHGVGHHTSVDTFEAALASRSINDFQLYASHPMGSCRMGVDPETSVIDPTGQTHRIQGLSIADSSIFPSSLGVNPQLTTMAMATMIGQRFRT